MRKSTDTEQSFQEDSMSQPSTILLCHNRTSLAARTNQPNFMHWQARLYVVQETSSAWKHSHQPPFSPLDYTDTSVQVYDVGFPMMIAADYFAHVRLSSPPVTNLNERLL